MRMRIVLVTLGLLAGGTAPGLQAQAGTDRAATGVYINGLQLSQDQLSELKQLHRLPASVQIPAGRYWYDKLSGAWGMEGGPTQGQILPGLNLGTLKADASGGGTGTFFNGRELHPLEVQYLRRIFGAVLPGRFWVNAQGIGGYEGGPPIFNIAAAAQQAGRIGGGYDGYTRRTPFGSLGSDGKCSYYMSPEGSSVMAGDC